MTDLFVGVSNQPAAVAALKAAISRPVHAYMLVGLPGVGKGLAATEFAAGLLCPHGGDGTCDTCRRVRIGAHPDVVVIERNGPYINMEMARDVVSAASRSPVEGDRKVLILTEFHLLRDAGPALLKTIEEPPASTIFVILADFVPPELVTVASRCVQLAFNALTEQQIAETLVAEGVEPERAAMVARGSAGRLDRARLLATDPDVERRRRAWESVPGRLDGSGAAAAVMADELIGLLDASVAPLRARQVDQMEELEARNARAMEVNGKMGRAGRVQLKAGVKEMDELHKRETRRQRTDELRAGLAALSVVYRDRLAGSNPRGQREALVALDQIQAMAVNLQYNPQELLSLQALFVRLSRATA